MPRFRRRRPEEGLPEPLIAEDRSEELLDGLAADRVYDLHDLLVETIRIARRRGQECGRIVFVGVEFLEPAHLQLQGSLVLGDLSLNADDVVDAD